MATLTIPALPPRLAQRYQVGPVLGRGVSSMVFRARDTLLRRDAAVKTFPVAPESFASSGWCVLAPADHPGLVPVYDVEHRDGRAFVVMALLEGGSLATRLEAHRESAGGDRAGGLALGESLRTVATVAGALDHLHHLGEAHRAVTPSNVVYDSEDRALLGDVGVAGLAATPRLGESGLPVTTAAYVAPEQLRGAVPGPQADVYALGLVLIEALTGRRAFPGDPESAARARLERAPTVPGGLPARVAELVSAMTADDPAQRPAAADAAAALRRALLETAPTLPLITGLGQPPAGAVSGGGPGAGGPAAGPRGAPADHLRPGITGGTLVSRRRGRRGLAGVAPARSWPPSWRSRRAEHSPDGSPTWGHHPRPWPSVVPASVCPIPRRTPSLRRRRRGYPTPTPQARASCSRVARGPRRPSKRPPSRAPASTASRSLPIRFLSRRRGPRPAHRSGRSPPRPTTPPLPTAPPPATPRPRPPRPASPPRRPRRPGHRQGRRPPLARPSEPTGSPPRPAPTNTTPTRPATGRVTVATPAAGRTIGPGQTGRCRWTASAPAPSVGAADSRRNDHPQ